MSDTLQLCSATLSVLPFVVVQCLGVSLSLSATCNISKYSLAFIFVISPFPLVCIKLLVYCSIAISISIISPLMHILLSLICSGQNASLKFRHA